MFNNVDDVSADINDPLIPIASPPVGVPQIFPDPASWECYVPEWATKMQLSATVGNVRIQDTVPATDTSFSFGGTQVWLGDVHTAVAEWITSFNGQAFGYSASSMSFYVADELEVPEEIRGTVQDLQIRSYIFNGSIGHEVGASWGTTAIVEAIFYEVPGF
jgi:hypothetical protein